MSSQLTMEERDRLAQLRSEKHSQQEIAAKLGRSPSTICRELKRNRVVEGYFPAQAHELSRRRRRERTIVRTLDRPETKDVVTSGLAHRPQVINDRQRLGDLEGDLVLGKPGCGGLLTAVDRRSRYTRMEKVHNKTAKHVYQRVKKVFHSLPQSQRLSITFNNGTEFAHCPLLEKHHGISLYLAEPGCPYQRGTNENTNGLIRQSFPKGTDFRTVTHAEVKRVENLLNNRPRAYLDYQPPAEVFFANPTNPNCDSH